VSLSGAGESLGHAINNPVAGMVIMNVIALTFEFVSSGVQSIRLLYYEFMGKFFHGEGIRFKPFSIRPLKPLSK
jgi:vacuolar-type H+-ATPase subunit I/STV1